MSDFDQVLAAGGLVPANAKLGKDAVVDTVVARAYRHPVLPGRTVVRLCAQGVAAGDDLEMATLGFAPGEDRGAVGKERKRPLGFPGWCLVNDPKNARYALDVVKELKKAARKAKSKPGHAKEAFDAIAAKLAKTVPHFLPSFYEEIGRVFIEHGALTYAAAFFGKARQTEAVHALEVDEQHRIDAFLEFALAGAVTTKALSEYAKELGDQQEPKVAYAHFRTLCLQRTLGGMPPWSGMSKDLGRLAKAAKLDVAEEDAAFIAEIIEAPALAKAAAEFWRAYREPIIALGQTSARARGALLNLFPRGSSYSAELDEVWLDLVQQSGAERGLIEDVEEEARPTGGRAVWFDKLTAHLGRSWRADSDAGKRVFDLLRRMAPKLIADGTPIKCSGRWHRIDLDLVELALELGVPVKTEEQAAIDCDGWAKQAQQPERGRDPVRAAAHPDLAPKLVLAVSQYIGNDAFDAASAGKQGFLAAKRAWLEAAIGGAETAALPALDDALQTIEKKVKASTFAELPDLHARFAALDVAPALARTLRVGTFDELGWPLLEEVRLELDPEDTGGTSLHGGPPAVILATKTRVVAFNSTGRLGTHDLVIPPKHEFVTARFIGGDFLVVLKQSYNVFCYWASAPADLWPAEHASVWSLPTVVPSATLLADGAWIESTTPMRAGDRKLALGNRVAACDGTTTWIAEWRNGEHKWYELTPTGEVGRQSWPAWVEEAAGGDDDWRVDLMSHYFPAPPGVTDSPLGIANGFVGARIRWRGGTIHAPEHRELETVDGRKLVSPKYIRPTNVLRMPDGELRPVGGIHETGKGASNVIYDPAMTFVASKTSTTEWRYARGQSAIVPLSFLHHYTPRDVEGSRRIHAATDDDARALIAAVPPPSEETKKGLMDLPGLLPEVTHPKLRIGIANLAAFAAQLRDTKNRLADERAPDKAQVAIPVGPDDKTLLAALGGWVSRQYAQSAGAWGQITRVGHAFAETDRSDRTITGFPLTQVSWFDLAVMPASLVVMALAIGTTPEHRSVLAQLYRLLGQLPPPDKLRVMHAKGKLVGPASGLAIDLHVRWIGGNAYAIRTVGYGGDQYHVLEYAPGGTFVNLPDVAIESEQRGAPPGPTTPDELAAVVAAGTTSWNADAAARLAEATGLSPSAAIYLWAGCPNGNDRGANFLDKELRETLGLKAAQAANARDMLMASAFDTKLAAIDELGRGGIAPLLDGTGADALAEIWKRRFGERVAVPEDLVAEAEAIGLVHNAAAASAAITLILTADKAPQLTVDGYFGFSEAGALISVRQPEPLVGQEGIPPGARFDQSTLATVSTFLPFLYAARPVGDPIRARAPAVYELVLARLANPHLWIGGGSTWMYEKEKVEAFDKMLDGIAERVPGATEQRAVYRLRGGVVTRANANIALYINPSELDPKARTEVDAVAKYLGEHGQWHHDYLKSLDLRAMMERIVSTPVPAGGWEQNPLLSVPDLVDKVARKLGSVSRDAAALYLQYLVLLWPTPKLLAEYNGWKPKQLEAAQGELVDHELILEAKRERAQRGHFLPGGWEALKSPHPPLETWKLALYGERSPTGHAWPRSGKFMAYAPFHLMFERAWARVESDDKPRYEEVKR